MFSRQGHHSVSVVFSLALIRVVSSGQVLRFFRFPLRNYLLVRGAVEAHSAGVLIVGKGADHRHDRLERFLGPLGRHMLPGGDYVLAVRPRFRREVLAVLRVDVPEEELRRAP